MILSLCTQRCYGRHNVSRKSTTSGLSILLHGVISFPDATSYVKQNKSAQIVNIFLRIVCFTYETVHLSVYNMFWLSNDKIFSSYPLN